MVPEIATAWTATTTVLKGLTAALKAVKDVETKQAISAILDDVLDMQSKLFAAQAQYEALTEVKRELEQKLVEHEQWDAQSTHYEFTKLAEGMFVYALKPDQAAGQHVHWLCPHCFEDHKKSYLMRTSVDKINYQCNTCGFDIQPTTAYPRTGDDLTATYEPEY